jgi:hypothetical protein
MPLLALALTQPLMPTLAFFFVLLLYMKTPVKPL